MILVQCSGQMLRRPEHGRLNCPELTTWIAKPGQKCRLECDGGYKPSIDRVSTHKLLTERWEAIKCQLVVTYH